MSPLIREFVPPALGLAGICFGCMLYVSYIAPRRDRVAVLGTLVFLALGSQAYDAFDMIAEERQDMLARSTASAASLLIVTLSGRILAGLLLFRLGRARSGLLAAAATLLAFAMHYLDAVEPRLLAGWPALAARAASGLLAFGLLVSNSLVSASLLIFVERRRLAAQAP